MIIYQEPNLIRKFGSHTLEIIRTLFYVTHWHQICNYNDRISGTQYYVLFGLFFRVKKSQLYL
jgi:hypothetical protein